MKKTTRAPKTRSKYAELNATLRNVEDALDRRLKVEKAILNIWLRYPRADLRDVIACLLEGEFPQVDGGDLHADLARPLGVALEDYDDGDARKADVTAILKSWTEAKRKNALRQKPVRIPTGR